MSCAEASSKPQLRGIWANLYSIRSKSNWGVGDFGDLRRLIGWAGEIGLAFVAVNPLHALRNRRHDVSPYRPVSRLYRNEIYLDMESIPEFEQNDEIKNQVRSPDFQSKLHFARQGLSIDYQAVLAIKSSILKPLHQTFRQLHGDVRSARGKEHQEYLRREGMALRDFATFMALDERYASGGRSDRGWRDWPGGLSDSRSAAVDDFRKDHAGEIDFHCWVQFELDRQLAQLAQFAKQSGLELGLFGDLAIGTAPNGSDSWAFPDLFVQAVSIGAPPDDLGPQGQNWGLPPINPHKLKETGYEFFRLLLRNNLAHMGALRIDHVMGLLRQFWIPEGFAGSKGAYVRFPAEDLFAILAEESRRAGAVIVGEDLGTVPEGFRDLLQKFGVLRTTVVHFERDWEGGFRQSNQYPSDAYAVVGTHDMVPLAGFAQGRDLQLRRQIGLIPSEEAFQAAMERRQRDWIALKARLKEEGLIVDDQGSDVSAVCGALIAFLAKSPSRMIGISLDDLTGETEPVNLPGVGPEICPSWSRRMTKPLKEILASQSICDAIRVRGAE